MQKVVENESEINCIVERKSKELIEVNKELH